MTKRKRNTGPLMAVDPRSPSYPYPQVGTPVLLPKPGDYGDYLITYQAMMFGQVQVEASRGTHDDVIGIAKGMCADRGMAWVYYPNGAGMLQLVHIEGEVEDLFRHDQQPSGIHQGSAVGTVGEGDVNGTDSKEV